MPQRTGRRRGRPPRDEAMDDRVVLPRVLQAFVRQGYDGVSVRALSTELGRGHTFLSDRYGTKEALWRAAVDHALRAVRPGVERSLAEPGDDLTRLVSAVRALHRAAAGSAQFARLIDQEARIDSDRLAYLHERIDPLNASLRTLFDRLVSKGAVRRMPWYLFYFLVTAPTSLYSQPPLARRLGRPDDAVDHELMSDLLLNGLLSKGD